MICKKCGKELNEHANFCTECGAVAEPTKPNADTEYDYQVQEVDKNTSEVIEDKIIDNAGPINNCQFEKPKKKRIRIFIMIVILVIISLSFFLGGRASILRTHKNSDDNETALESNSQTENQTSIAVSENPFKNVHVGEKIWFGSYEQDGNYSNGKEEIEWRVLDKRDGQLLVISEYALDSVPFNNKNEECKWETCTLREWLNSTFYNECFSKEEQKIIKESNVTTEANLGSDGFVSVPGNPTNDKLFLLSDVETDNYFKSDYDRMCVASAAIGSSKASSFEKEGEKTCKWFLRTTGAKYSISSGNMEWYVCEVGYDGKIETEGSVYLDFRVCIRPAMWINATEENSYTKINEGNEVAEEHTTQAIPSRKSKSRNYSGLLRDINVIQSESKTNRADYFGNVCFNITLEDFIDIYNSLLSEDGYDTYGMYLEKEDFTERMYTEEDCIVYSVILTDIFDYRKGIIKEAIIISTYIDTGEVCDIEYYCTPESFETIDDSETVHKYVFSKINPNYYSKFKDLANFYEDCGDGNNFATSWKDNIEYSCTIEFQNEKPFIMMAVRPCDLYSPQYFEIQDGRVD